MFNIGNDRNNLSLKAKKEMKVKLTSKLPQIINGLLWPQISFNFSHIIQLNTYCGAKYWTNEFN